MLHGRTLGISTFLNPFTTGWHRRLLFLHLMVPRNAATPMRAAGTRGWWGRHLLRFSSCASRGKVSSISCIRYVSCTHITYIQALYDSVVSIQYYFNIISSQVSKKCIHRSYRIFVIVLSFISWESSHPKLGLVARKPTTSTDSTCDPLRWTKFKRASFCHIYIYIYLKKCMKSLLILIH